MRRLGICSKTAYHHAILETLKQTTSEVVGHIVDLLTGSTSVEYEFSIMRITQIRTLGGTGGTGAAGAGAAGAAGGAAGGAGTAGGAGAGGARRWRMQTNVY